jgi:hypothetical protein
MGYFWFASRAGEIGQTNISRFDQDIVYNWRMKIQIPIYETENFYIQAASHPFIDRAEGGHIYLFPKAPLRDRTQLTPKLTIEYTKLSMIIGEALKSAMARRGVDIGIINYQEKQWGTQARDRSHVIMAALPRQRFRNMTPSSFRTVRLDFMTTSSR